MVTVQLPAGGAGARSETKPEGGSTDGEEVGKDYENKVGEGFCSCWQRQMTNLSLRV